MRALQAGRLLAILLTVTASQSRAQPSAEEARAPQTLATFPLPREVGPGEILVLVPAGEAARLRIEPAEEKSALRSLQLMVDLLPEGKPSAFGVEERCRVARTNGAIVIQCAAGGAPAGALISFPARYPIGARAEGRLAASGGEGFAAQLVTADSEAEALVPVADYAVLPLPAVGSGAAHLVVVAPQAGGTLHISRLSIEPLSTPAQASAGGWAWEPDLWRRRGGELIEAAARRGLARLYVTLAIEDGRIRHRSELIRFLRAARGRGIAVEAVEGDPDMVNPDGLRSAVKRAQAIARFDRAAPAGARLAGVQYDIEPYTLPSWGTYPADYRGWTEAVRALASAAGGPVHLVLPFWIADNAGGLRLLRELGPSISGVTAMAYRSDPAAIGAITEPLLSWGVTAGKPVRIALEAGPVAPETRSDSAPPPPGASRSSKRAAHARAAAGAGGASRRRKMFASQGRITVEPARISFLGDEARMMRAAAGLRAAFGPGARSRHVLSRHRLAGTARSARRCRGLIWSKRLAAEVWEGVAAFRLNSGVCDDQAYSSLRRRRVARRPADLSAECQGLSGVGRARRRRGAGAARGGQARCGGARRDDAGGGRL
jgi:hypothetical protein